jgi:hypothetical protein
MTLALALVGEGGSRRLAEEGLLEELIFASTCPSPSATLLPLPQGDIVIDRNLIINDYTPPTPGDILAIPDLSHTLVLANYFDPVFAAPKYEVDMLVAYGWT